MTISQTPHVEDPVAIDALHRIAGTQHRQYNRFDEFAGQIAGYESRFDRIEGRLTVLSEQVAILNAKLDQLLTGGTPSGE